MDGWRANRFSGEKEEGVKRIKKGRSGIIAPWVDVRWANKAEQFGETNQEYGAESGSRK